MDQDLRDDSISNLVDVTILWPGHESFTTNVHSKCPLQFLRQEILLLWTELDKKKFKLDGQKIRSRKEIEMTSGDCASPHVLELVCI